MRLGDEAIPVCQRCSKAQRYCDRSRAPPKFHNKGVQDETEAESTGNDNDLKCGMAPTWLINIPDSSAPGMFPSPEKPRDALLNPSVARYFHHYITDIAPWYDLSDSSQLFGTKLPEIALEKSLPFAAILALSAVHVSQTTAPSAKAAAEFYHGHCIRILIGLNNEDHGEAVTRGLALASVCLLRSYEILSGTPRLCVTFVMKLTLRRRG